ncbi:MAG: hypothetical protein HY749_14790 [Gammaproteobacteria bacterium]|nr:hypothetical protein [Gammaproteobacteria bacterium]
MQNISAASDCPASGAKRDASIIPVLAVIATACAGLLAVLALAGHVGDASRPDVDARGAGAAIVHVPRQSPYAAANQRRAQAGRVVHGPGKSQQISLGQSGRIPRGAFR